MNQYPERTTQVLRVGERLELPDFSHRRRGGIGPHTLGDAREKFRLRNKRFRLEPHILALAHQLGEVHMRGQILFARSREQIIADRLSTIGAESSVPTFRSQELFGQHAIIDRAQTASPNHLRRVTPPVTCVGADFKDIAIRQHSTQLRRQDKPSAFKRFLTVKRRIEHPSPNELFSVQRDAPFEPTSLICIPAETVDRKRIDQFIGENDAGDTVRLQIGKGIYPTNAIAISPQRGLLPSAAGFGRLNQNIRDTLKDTGVAIANRTEKISSQPAIVCPGLDPVDRTGKFFTPRGELGGKKPPKQAPDTDAGDKITAPTN